MSETARMNDAALQCVKQERAGNQEAQVAPHEGEWISLVLEVSCGKLTRCVENRKNQERGHPAEAGLLGDKSGGSEKPR